MALWGGTEEEGNEICEEDEASPEKMKIINRLKTFF